MNALSYDEDVIKSLFTDKYDKETTLDVLSRLESQKELLRH